MSKPSWIRQKLPNGPNFNRINSDIAKNGLSTVCSEANCPNRAECWENKTVTILILGDTCTRSCKFCSIKTGNPHKKINPTEITNVLAMVQTLQAEYLVLTSVDRDDLDDFGATHFANTVKAVKNKFSNIKIETLIPDFSGTQKSMDILALSGPTVIGQNIETVKRLTPKVRDRRSSYQLTLEVLHYYKKNYPQISTKSSIMLGLGENMQEIKESLTDLKNANVDIITIGQYLQPNRQSLKVEKYYSPDEFIQLNRWATNLGFKFVHAGPLVRSSYKAHQYTP